LRRLTFQIAQKRGISTDLDFGRAIYYDLNGALATVPAAAAHNRRATLRGLRRQRQRNGGQNAQTADEKLAPHITLWVDHCMRLSTILNK
jgi:hypothetical protein